MPCCLRRHGLGDGLIEEFGDGLIEEFRCGFDLLRCFLDVDEDVSRIYSLACPASPRHYQKDPIGTMKTCVMGTLNILELALKKGARVLQASTSEVYGDPEIHPQPESYLGNVNPIGRRFE